MTDYPSSSTSMLRALGAALFGVALLSACSPKTAAITPQGVPQASPTIGSTSAQKNAATSVLVAPAPTAISNLAATLQTGQLWATQTERAYERAVIGLTSTQQAVSNGFAYASQTARAPELTARAQSDSTSIALQSARMTEWIDHQRATEAYPTLVLAAANAKEQARFAGLRAVTQPIFEIGMPLVLGAFVLALFLAIRNRPAPMQPAPEPEEFPELHKLDPKLMHPGDTMDMDRTPPGDPVKFSQFATYALSGFALGVNAVEKSTPYTRDEYAPVYVWMDRKSFIGPGRDGKSKGLSASGARYCEEWLEHNPVPPPQGEDEPKHDAIGS